MSTTAPVRAARLQCRQLVEGGVSKKQATVRRCLMDAFDCVAQAPDLQPSVFDFLNASALITSKPSWFVLTPQRAMGSYKAQAKSPAERSLSFGFR